MPKEIKINLSLKKFLLVSMAVNLVLGIGFVRTQTEFWVFVFNYWVIIGYLVFLVKGGKGMADAALGATASKANTSGIVFMFLGKILLIFGALSLSVHFIGNKILVPLLNYIIHIFILAYALRDQVRTKPLSDSGEVSETKDK